MIRSDLKRIREAHGMTQAELGAAIGVCTRTIINAETCCGREPSFTTILLIAHYFRLPVEEIFSLEE